MQRRLAQQALAAFLISAPLFASAQTGGMPARSQSGLPTSGAAQETGRSTTLGAAGRAPAATLPNPPPPCIQPCNTTPPPKPRPQPKPK